VNSSSRVIGGAENAGVENAGVENAGAITYGKPSEEKTKIPVVYAKTKRSQTGLTGVNVCARCIS